MFTSTSVYVIGDIHGQFKKLARLLREAGLVDDALAWAGRTPPTFPHPTTASRSGARPSW